MKGSTASKVLDIASRYYVTGHSVRRIAEHFGVSKSYVGACLTHLGEKYLDNGTYELVRKRVESNMSEFRKYGRLLPSDDYAPDIRLDDIDTHSHGDICGMKDFFVEDSMDDMWDDYDESVLSEDEVLQEIDQAMMDDDIDPDDIF